MIRPAKFMASLLVVAVSTLATVFVLEFAVRWTIPEFDPSGHVRFLAGKGDRPVLGEPDTQQRQIKNTGDFDVTIRFNKYGFRDDRDVAESTQQDFFVVGDSLSFGWGVEETERASERLEVIIGRPVYNISILGDLNDSEKLIAHAEKNGAKIGNLLVFFSTEVRLKNYDAPVINAQNQGLFTKEFLMRTKITLMQNSALYFLVTLVIHRQPALKSLAVKAGLINPNLEGFPIHEFNPKVIKSSAKRLARFADNKNRKVIIVVLPMRTLWVGPSQKTEDKIWRTLISRLRELNLNVIDLRPDFEAGGNPLGYFFKNDGHWNASGHAMVGRTVARYLGFEAQAPTQQKLLGNQKQ